MEHAPSHDNVPNSFFVLFADKESTSVEGPSLVPPTDGLHQPVHASGTASTPLAHSISTQISDCSNLSTATESSKPPTNLPKADAVCDGDQSSHHWSGHSVGDDRSTAVPDSPLSNDEGTGSILASADELADSSVPDLEAEQNDFIIKSAESYIHTASHNEQSNLELHTDDLPCSSVSALVYDVDEGQQKMAALCDSAEDTLEVDTETIPYPAIDVECCRRLFTDVAVAGLSELQENAENQPVSSNDMTVDVVSEEVDSTTKQDYPNPANISGQDLQESCFSLATALKELHKLLVTSGQGSCRSVADGKAFSESIITDVDQGNNPECSQEGDSNDNYYEIGNEVSLCDENICIKDPEDSMCTETTVSTTDVCSDGVESYVEPSNILGSPLIHTTSPSEVRLSSNGNDVYDGNLPRLSTDPEGLVGEQISSGPQPDPSFSSASAVERIVHAGFSLPDALLALERAEGNVELALLALLAKNIVVPT
ncbi:regulatory solute carrier protein family 1 member 1 [Mixophyes fleayi]|uniref:regulatory solute carrier protein family 1 member 1 n=1 Tax=Mixophyes fleayi TaxID=3061075 RepID=UPI003F4DE8DE